MKIINVVGARPNFMKVAPLHRAFVRRPDIDSKIVHTGQHYDAKMSDIFFEQLGIPTPDYHLGVGPGSSTQQTAHIMTAFEAVLEETKPDLVLVVGDVTSTVACSLTAVRLGIAVAHVEAGLRSADRTMPEEINRIVTDNLSNYLFVSEPSGIYNLANEGVPEEKIFYVGNTMIDSLVYAQRSLSDITVLSDLHIASHSYILLTMHRPANVDTVEGLDQIVTMIEIIAEETVVVWPIHPRTQANLTKFGLLTRLEKIKSLRLIEPQGYLSFLKLMESAAVVVTDSGGIQEETTFLQVPCLTLRDTTERPVTISMGTNDLLTSWTPGQVYKRVREVLSGDKKLGFIPPLWDGKAAERIATILSGV